jgi:hypothetical protein
MTFTSFTSLHTHDSCQPGDDFLRHARTIGAFSVLAYASRSRAMATKKPTNLKVKKTTADKVKGGFAGSPRE